LRSPNHPDEHDLDVALMRRTPPQMTSVKHGHGGRRGKRGIGRYLVGGLVALVLVLFGGVIWFAYQDLMPGGDEAPPVIRADATPIKREPGERGGLPLLNDESAVVQGLDEPDSPVRVERIMPRETTAPRSTADVIPEALEAEPLSDSDLAATDLARADSDLVVAEAEAEVDPATDAGEAGTGDSLDTLLAEIVDGQGALSAIEPAAGPAAPNRATLDDVPQPADGLALPEGDVVALASPSATTPAAPASAATAPTASVAAPAASPATTQSTPAPAPVTASAPAPTPVPVTAPEPAAAVEPPPPVATPRAVTPAETTVASLPPPALAQDFVGAYGVQLLAVRDEAAAAGAWSGLQQQHPAVLGALRSRVQRADIGGNTFYRLQAGPFAARADANAVCAALQARGIDCFIVEPTS
jgi:hypothetical protein